MTESHAERSRSRREDEQVEAPIAQTADGDQAQGDDEEFDSLLDEIDDVLEVNAEEFVRSFVQKGGQ